MGAEAAAELPFKAAQYIQSAAAGFSPEYCIVLGPGLADLTDLVADQIVIPYRDDTHRSDCLTVQGMSFCPMQSSVTHP